MEDDKKTTKWEIEVIVAIVLIIIIALSGGLMYYFNPVIAFFVAQAPYFTGALRDIYDFLIVISFPVSLIFLIGTIVAVERLKVIRRKEQDIYGPPKKPASEPSTTAVSPPASRGSAETANHWRKILVLADSDNQNDWKQAIIDADAILDDMLSKMGYHGDDLGSKLRSATKADFKTLDQAWEAHKVRNDIAHEGPDFLISKHEAKRVVNLYKQVFEEFFYI